MRRRDKRHQRWIQHPTAEGTTPNKKVAACAHFVRSREHASRCEARRQLQNRYPQLSSGKEDCCSCEKSRREPWGDPQDP